MALIEYQKIVEHLPLFGRALIHDTWSRPITQIVYDVHDTLGLSVFNIQLLPFSSLHIFSLPPLSTNFYLLKTIFHVLLGRFKGSS